MTISTAFRDELLLELLAARQRQAGNESSCRRQQPVYYLPSRVLDNEADALTVVNLPPQVREMLIFLIQILQKLLLSAQAPEVERQQDNSRNSDQAVPPEMAGEETVPEATGHAALPHQPANGVPGQDGAAPSHAYQSLPIPALEIFLNVGDILRRQGKERFTAKDMMWDLGARRIELSQTTLLNRLKAAHSFFLAYGWEVLKFTKRRGITFLPDAWTAWEEAERLLGKVTLFSPERER